MGFDMGREGKGRENVSEKSGCDGGLVAVSLSLRGFSSSFFWQEMKIVPFFSLAIIQLI